MADSEHGFFGRNGRTEYPSGLSPQVALEPLPGTPGSEAPESLQHPLAHPQDIQDVFESLGSDSLPLLEESAQAAQRINRFLARQAVEEPRYHQLHDRLRTLQAWERQVDAVYDGAVTTPAAGANTLTNIFVSNPLLPGNPGTELVYPYVNFFSIAAAGTTLTGLWSCSLIVNGVDIPLGVFSGLGSFTNRAGLMAGTPFAQVDDTTPIAQLRVSIASGATVSAVTMYAQLSLAYAYRYIEAPRRKSLEAGRGKAS